MFRSIKTLNIILALVFIIPGISAIAAKDGDVGETSTGNIKAKVTVKREYIITGLQDYVIEPFMAGAITKAIKGPTENICIGTNDITRKASVTVSGDTGGDGFILEHSENSKLHINYTLDINDGSTTYDMAPDEPTIMNASFIDECQDGDTTHTLQLTINSGQARLTAGEYSGDINFLIGPPSGN